MVDVEYCDDPNLVQLLPGAAEGLRSLIQAGYRIIIITNQSGIGRGYFDVGMLERIHDRLRAVLREGGADFHAIYYCPHKPEDECECRKPKPGLFLRAASELNIDLGSSYTLGDRNLDVEAGKAAGTRTILISNNTHIVGSAIGNQADFVVRNLPEAANLILSDLTIRGAGIGQRTQSRSERN
jgi:D-glycero-D-manno-heptose 1,7-bisphosphate phosphatase